MKKILILLYTAGLTGLSQAEPYPDAIKNLSDRSFPDVIRCVIDDRPRMLVIKLDDRHAIAYDTWHCLLGKAWQNKEGPLVNFDGAVYNGIHKPQPNSIGDSIFNNFKAEFSSPLGKLQYLGHYFKDGEVELRYGIKDKDFKVVATIVDKPTFKDGKLTRTITASPASAAGKITFVPVPSMKWSSDNKEVKKATLAKPISITTSL